MSEGISENNQDIFLDLARQRRCGFPEAIFGEGKRGKWLLLLLPPEAGFWVPFNNAVASKWVNYICTQSRCSFLE